MYSVIVGIGNPLFGDDAIGLEVVKKLKEKNKEKNVDIKLCTAGGLELAEIIADYDLAIIVDAVKGLNGVKEISIDDYKESVANHDISFPSAYRILSKYIKMPKVRIVGIGINNIEIKEEISNETKEKIPVAIKFIKKMLEEENEFVGES